LEDLGQKEKKRNNLASKSGPLRKVTKKKARV